MLYNIFWSQSSEYLTEAVAFSEQFNFCVYAQHAGVARERERDRETERDRERERDRETETERDTERERQID